QPGRGRLRRRDHSPGKRDDSAAVRRLPPRRALTLAMTSRMRSYLSASVALLLVLGPGGTRNSLSAQGGQQQPQQPQQQQPPQRPQPGGAHPAAEQQPQTGQPQTDPNQPPVFRSGINFVRVDVILTDRSGSPIADLQPTDFDVTEDGKPQKIETFKFIKLD